MNICIVTVYNTHNCGSFLQAWSLARVLIDNGHDVFFLKRDLKNTPHTLSNHLSIAIKKALKLDFNTAKNELKTQRNYDSAQKCFCEIDINSPKINTMDYFVFGSDTIWNLQDSYFKANMSKYFGMDITGKKVSYAPSISNTEIDKFESDEIRNALGEFCALSARDEKTRDMIKAVAKIDAPLVCDPTLLLSKDSFNDLIADKKTINDAPIFIYHFLNMDNRTISTIKQYAKDNNKRIVSMGRDCVWCDEVIPYDPYLFLQYFRDSSYVITNTFHGTLLSLIYEKDFLCLGKGKAKIEHIMEIAGASDMLYAKDDDISNAIGAKIDYTRVNDNLNKFRQKSLDYIKDNIK